MTPNSVTSTLKNPVFPLAGRSYEEIACSGRDSRVRKGVSDAIRLWYALDKSSLLRYSGNGLIRTGSFRICQTSSLTFLANLLSLLTMSTRSTNLQRPSALSIHPPSPSIISNPTLSTPTNSTTFPNNLSSPRRAPVPPSPTHSTYSSATVPWLDDRSRRGSFDGVNKLERRSPLLPPSPHKREGKGGFAYAGAYDNKLVSARIPFDS